MNWDISVNIQLNKFRFSLVILNSIMEGTVSQIIFLGPIQILCNLENEVLKKCKEFPVFGHKSLTKP